MKKKKINEICIIEDDRIQIFLLKKYIEKTGLVETVNIYENGKLAYDEFESRSKADNQFPDIIFLDINMPVWNGWQFYKSFLMLPESAYATTFVLTSSLSKEDKLKAKNFGLEERYLLKPLKLELLRDILNSFSESLE